MASEEPVDPETPAVTPKSVIVHPIVVFGILDHYIRRQEGQERVIGTLLGHLDEETGIVEVSNAYAVPHTESGGEVAVGAGVESCTYSFAGDGSSSAAFAEGPENIPPRWGQ